MSANQMVVSSMSTPSSVREGQRLVLLHRLLRWRRDVGEAGTDRAYEQADLDDGKHAVQHGEADERRQHLAERRTRRDTGAGLHQPEDQPGLATHLGED